MNKLVFVPALVAAILIAALAAAARPAHATFPGVNGRIVFTRNRSGTDNIFSMKPDGTDVRQLTFLTPDVGGDGQGVWSPDARTVVFNGPRITSSLRMN